MYSRSINFMTLGKLRSSESDTELLSKGIKRVVVARSMYEPHLFFEIAMASQKPVGMLENTLELCVVMLASGNGMQDKDDNQSTGQARKIRRCTIQYAKASLAFEHVGPSKSPREARCLFALDRPLRRSICECRNQLRLMLHDTVPFECAGRQSAERRTSPGLCRGEGERTGPGDVASSDYRCVW